MGLHNDPALDALFHVLDPRAVNVPAGSRCAFLRARAGQSLRAAGLRDLRCEQSFRPWAALLETEGYDVVPELSGSFDRVFVLAARQREESRALLARGLTMLAPGGQLVASATNNEGARSLESDLRSLVDAVDVASKHKSRVVWTLPGAQLRDPVLVDQWRALDEVRPVCDGRYLSRPGLFSWDRIDAGSALLAEHLPSQCEGAAADLGAGFGYLSCELLRVCSGLTRLDCFEAEARALEPLRRNLDQARDALTGSVPQTTLHWHDVTRGMGRGGYALIISNPPFHQGRADQPGLGLAFISAAADALLPHGELRLVANRHLPYEAMLRRRFRVLEQRADAHGFKVYRAAEPQT